MLTPHQEGCLFSIQSLTSENKEGKLDIHTKRQKIKEAYLAFQIAIFNHKLKLSKYKSGIISGLVVIGLDINKGGQFKAQNFTLVLLAIIIVVRTLVGYQAHIVQQRKIYRLQRQGLKAYKSKAKVPSTFKLVKRIVH